jgi:gag-polypeptide of LTR copia-type
MASSSSKHPPDKLEPARIQPLFFEPLKSDGSNYLKWSATAEMHLVAKDVAGTIVTSTPTEVSPAAKAWAILLLQKHLDKALQDQYVQEKNPAVLWSTLASRFSQERRLHLPGAQQDWINLRAMDFNNLASYNDELHRIVAQLRLCGETITETNLMDKTLYSLPPASNLLSIQYRNMNLPTHAELMSLLMLAEKQQQISLQVAESKPTKEVNATEISARRPKGTPGGSLT